MQTPLSKYLGLLRKRHDEEHRFDEVVNSACTDFIDLAVAIVGSKGFHASWLTFIGANPRTHADASALALSFIQWILLGEDQKLEWSTAEALSYEDARNPIVHRIATRFPPIDRQGLITALDRSVGRIEKSLVDLPPEPKL